MNEVGACEDGQRILSRILTMLRTLDELTEVVVEMFWVSRFDSEATISAVVLNFPTRYYL